MSSCDELFVKILNGFPSDWIESKFKREFVLNAVTYNESSKELIQRVKDSLPADKLENDELYKSFISTLNESMLKPPPEDPGNKHVSGIDLFDLFRVTLNFSNATDDRFHKVYGEIIATNMDGALISLFSRERENPMLVPEDGTLLLHHSKFRVIDLCTVVEVKLCIWEGDQEIANGAFSVDYDNLSDYNQVIVQHISGKFGSAVVEYAKLGCAVLALINVELSGFNGDVYGSVAAYRSNIADGKQSSSSSSVLFMADEEEPVNIVDGATNIVVSGSAVCVPSFSSLVIRGNIWDHNTGVKLLDELEELEFRAKDSYYLTKQRSGRDGLIIKVVVQWRHPSVPCPELSILKTKKGKKTGKNKKKTKKGNFLQGLCVPKPFTKGMTWTMVNVFSILVGSFTNDCLSVYGKISVTDDNATHCIFDQGKDCPQRLGPLGELVCEGPSNFALCAECFIMKLELKDTHGRIISKGSLCMDLRDLEMPISWYDMRLCAAVKGDVGYAIAHHTVFSAAVKARVSFYLFRHCFDGIEAKVCGKIVAYDPNYEHKSVYQRQFYRRTLFMKLENDCASVHCRPQPPGGLKNLGAGETKKLTNLTLLRAYLCSPWFHASLAVPRYSSLAVEVDLRACAYSYTEALQGKVVFELDSCGTFFKMIGKGNYDILISVETVEYRKNSHGD